MLKRLMLISLVFLCYSAVAQNTNDTFHIYFDLNIPTLNKNAEKKIDLLIYNDKIILGSSVMVIGYADFLGSETHNKNLSMQRAKNIKDYLVKYGINPSDVKMCVGHGEIERKGMTDKEGSPIDRRVDIVVDNKVTSSFASSGANSGRNSGRSGKSVNSDKYSSTAHNNELGNPNKHVKIDTSKRVYREISELSSLKPGQKIKLKNVHFPLSSHVMLPESYESVEKLYTILKDNPNLRISIEGHVCCLNLDLDERDATDIDTNEPLLSVNRAKAIAEYLVKKGIDAGRLQYAGFGKKYPIVQNERSEEDAALNRRVEIRVVSN